VNRDADRGGVACAPGASVEPIDARVEQSTSESR
jgi:hypothetical protein